MAFCMGKLGIDTNSVDWGLVATGMGEKPGGQKDCGIDAATFCAASFWGCPTKALGAAQVEDSATAGLATSCKGIVGLCGEPNGLLRTSGVCISG